jgi:hypothetical protein
LIYYGRLARALQAHEMNFGLPVPKELLGEEEEETVRAKHEGNTDGKRKRLQ